MPIGLEGGGTLLLEGTAGALALEGETVSTGDDAFYQGEPTRRRWYARPTHLRWYEEHEVRLMQFKPTPHTSLQDQGVDIEAIQAGELIDPTVDTVQLAFKSNGRLPEDADWQTAVWETDAITDPNRPIYTALCFVGPGGTIELPVGNYKVFVKVITDREIPVIPIAGVLQIT